MMTSDERIVVAESLRHARGIREFVDVLGVNNDSDWTWDDVNERVADLIDPTCHIEDDDWASRRCMGPMLSCDRCGNAFPEINGPYQYCPCCGARVVDN